MRYLPAWVLLLLSWLQPFHAMPWMSWHSEVSAAAALVWLLGVELLHFARLGRAVSVPRSVGVLLVVAFYALAQFAAGQISYLGDALVVCIYLGVAGMAVLVGYVWGARAESLPAEAEDGSVLPQLAWVVLTGALLSVVLALAQLLSVWRDAAWIFQLDYARRPGANMGQPNHLATLLLMGLASMLFLCESGRISRTLAGIFWACLLLGLIMSESRTGLLTLAVMTAWWWWHRSKWLRIGRLGPVLLSWLALLPLVWAWPSLFAAYYFVPAGTALVSSTPGGRMVVWPQLWEAVMLRPWLGWGLREVPEAHNAVVHHYAVSEPYGYAHNILLDLALGVGLPLTLVLLVVVARWAWVRLSRVVELQAWYSVALVIPLAVHAMTEFPYAYTYLLVPAGLAVGILEARLAAASIWRLRWPGVAAAGVLLSLLMLVSAVEYLAIEEDFQVTRFEVLRIGSPPPGYEHPHIRLLTQMDAMLQVSRAVPRPGMTFDELDYLRRAAMRFPSIAAQNRYALALALNGNPDEAVRQLQVMRAMHGEKHYAALRTSWVELGRNKYPQLQQLQLP
jgi:hypothetical protein